MRGVRRHVGIGIATALGALAFAPAAGAATFTGSATPTAPLGASIVDTATIDVAPPAGMTPTGTIIFNVYGPNDPICAAPIPAAHREIPVNGDGSYVSNPPFTPTAMGTYYWDLAYTGGNYPDLAAPCNPLNTAQTSIIGPPLPPVVATPVAPTVTPKKKCKKGRKLKKGKCVKKKKRRK